MEDKPSPPPCDAFCITLTDLCIYTGDDYCNRSGKPRRAHHILPDCSMKKYTTKQQEYQSLGN